MEKLNFLKLVSAMLTVARAAVEAKANDGEIDAVEGITLVEKFLTALGVSPEAD